MKNIRVNWKAVAIIQAIVILFTVLGITLSYRPEGKEAKVESVYRCSEQEVKTMGEEINKGAIFVNESIKIVTSKTKTCGYDVTTELIPHTLTVYQKIYDERLLKNATLNTAWGQIEFCKTFTPTGGRTGNYGLCYERTGYIPPD